MTTNFQLSDEELEQLALFGLGLAVGFALFVILRRLVEEWVIASDQADRERIRELIREALEASIPKARAAALVLTPGGKA